MPADYGTLSSRDQVRLRAARRRAGIEAGENRRKQLNASRDSTTVSAVRRETAVTEKARRDFPTKKPVTSAVGAAVRRGGPVPAHMMVEPKLQTMFQKAGLNVGSGLGDALEATGIPKLASDAYWSVTHPVDRLTGKGRAKEQRMEWIGGFGFGGGITSALPRTSSRIGSRTSQYKGRTQQFPQSPSLFTSYTQRLKDKAFERTGAAADKLRDSESVLARGVGKAITPVSARAAVPKQAGKMRKKESMRHRAAQAEHVRNVRDVGKVFPGVRTEPAQAAHSWLAQVPATYRNEKGLALIRGKKQEELQDRLSGGYTQRLDKAEQRIRAEQRAAQEAGDNGRVFKLLNDIEDIRALRADLPEQIADLTTDVNKLDKLIAKPPRIDPVVIESMRALMADRKRILTEAGQLDPERAANREGLFSRWLGLEPDGTEVYVGHRQGRVKYQRPSGTPGGMALGKTQLPQGVGTTNDMKLVSMGRERKDLKSVIEDWQAAQVYDFHNVAKAELAQMGSPVLGSVYKPRHVLLNPRGHEIPRTMKIDREAQAKAEGFDPEDVVVEDAKELLQNYLAEGQAASQKMLQQAAEAGHLEDLRWIPNDVAKRYYAQFLPTKINAATPGVREEVNIVGKGLDVLNDALYASLIYTNPGYVPAAMAANTILGGLQQGVLLPVNLSRGTQVLLPGAPQRVRDLMRGEVGASSSTSLASETSPLRKVGDIAGALGDEPFRLSSFIHEAARAKVIPKAKPYLDEKDYARLEDLLTNPDKRAVLNDVSDRAVQAMIDFGRLGSKERAFAKRAGFVWGFLRGAARYPGRFVLDHPGRAVALAGGAYAGQDEIRDVTMDDLPSWMGGTLKWGEKVIDGKTYPTGLRTRSYDPGSPLMDLAATATGHSDARTFLEMANPLGSSVMRALDKRTASGFDAKSYRDAVTDNSERLVPWIKRGRELVSPPEDTGMFPEDATRLGRLKRELRVLPVAIDPTEAKATRERELARTGRGATAAVKDHQKRMAALRADAKAHGVTSPEDAIKASRRIRTIDLDVKRLAKRKGEKLTSEEKARAAFRTYSKAFPTRAPTWQKRFAAGADEDRWQSYYEDMRAEVYEPYSRLEIPWDR